VPPITAKLFLNAVTPGSFSCPKVTVPSFSTFHPDAVIVAGASAICALSIAFCNQERSTLSHHSRIGAPIFSLHASPIAPGNMKKGFLNCPQD
jgi:hypothetical protein